MSTANNHRKRSHRSSKRSLGTRPVGVPTGKILLANDRGTFARMLRAISRPRERAVDAIYEEEK